MYNWTSDPYLSAELDNRVELCYSYLSQSDVHVKIDVGFQFFLFHEVVSL